MATLLEAVEYSLFLRALATDQCAFHPSKLHACVYELYWNGVYFCCITQASFSEKLERD